MISFQIWKSLGDYNLIHNRISVIATGYNSLKHRIKHIIGLFSYKSHAR